MAAGMARGMSPIGQMHDPPNDTHDRLRVDATGLDVRFVVSFQGNDVDDRPPKPGRMV